MGKVDNLTKLRWEDIAGGASGAVAPAGNAAISIPGAAQGEGLNLTGLTGQLKDGLDLIKMIDQYVGLFKGMTGQRPVPADDQAIDGQVIPQELPGGQRQLAAAQVVLPAPTPQAPAPAQPELRATPDQVTALLAKVIKGEGDIPLSKFLQGIEGSEPWIIKYALELVAGT